MVLSPCRDSISVFLGSFWSVGVFFGQRALTIERSVRVGVVRVMNLQRTSKESCESRWN